MAPICNLAVLTTAWGSATPLGRLIKSEHEQGPTKAACE
jgi:hypothetical protein